MHYHFMGGEPLLEFELIKKCVSYILQRKGDKKILFTMTTNGTLLKFREKATIL